MSGQSTLRRLDFSDDHDYRSAIDVMVQSFARLPTWSHLYRLNDTSAAAARVKYYMHAVAELGEIWAFERDTPGSGIVMEGVVGFLPPEKAYSDASTINRDREACTRALGLDSVPQSHTPPSIVWTSTALDVPAALASSWNITLIGTIPSATGQGLGSRMTQLVVDRATEQGQGVWVYTTYEPRKRFYTRLGFEHVQTLQTVNELGEDAFEYVMCMSPCKSAAVGEKSA